MVSHNEKVWTILANTICQVLGQAILHIPVDGLNLHHPRHPI